jgi:hypothetical protein
MWRKHEVVAGDYAFHSNAEESIFSELQRRGLTTSLTTQKGFEFNLELDGVHGTEVDDYWGSPYNYAVFIDGPHHLKLRQERKDELITKALERRGIKVDRFLYKPPLRKKRKLEICKKIEAVLTSKGYFQH